MSDGKKLSRTLYKKMALKTSGRSIMSVKKIARSALFKITLDVYGKNTAENREHMRQHFASGLDANTMGRYAMHLEKLAMDNADSHELRCLAYANDYVPMLSGTIGMRYGGRQRGCGLIPKYETDWFHAVQPGSGDGARLHWHCPACSGEFTFNKEATEGGRVDGRGQDKPYQYVLFFELPWKGASGLRTFCAKAAAPTDQQQQQLNVLKLIAALGGITMKPGFSKTLLDMIVEANESFDRMVHSSFPRKTAVVKHPVHEGIGKMVIAGCGSLSLRETAVGTSLVFYDVSKAEEEGYFGKGPKIWQEADYHSLIEILTIGLCSSPAEWAKLRWRATEWTGTGKKCSPSQIKTLEALANIAASPSPVAASALLHPVFSAKDIFGDFGDGASNSGSVATAASGRGGAHLGQTKSMLTSIVKGATTGLEGAPKKNVRINVKEATARTSSAPSAGKNTARNAKRKANARMGQRRVRGDQIPLAGRIASASAHLSGLVSGWLVLF